ncbi:hypothetical protein [Pontixanthobacter aquaemixtae]|uniref:Uncharacterized protein n=1 Tax=Pontixanthobacter aquaemixtae TaxID=1958940 RepID=A0A844ZUL1_9SPHN|nr:hypothetical protein [Pontixanthobacter aquaemixtae]MXO89229.1 hypothetical protein [Pontixanthobacter aquaemixtae]
MAAQDQAEPALDELTDKLSDPVEQDKMASMVDAMGEVLLQMPVGPLLDAAAKLPGADMPEMDRDATMRDLAGPDADELPGQLSSKVPMMMGMLSEMIKGLDAMRPALEDMGKQMQERIESPAQS